MGGTNLRGAIINEDGKISTRKKIKSDAKDGIKKLVQNLLSFIDQFSEFKPTAIGIGIPGIINQKDGKLIQAPNISDVSNYPIVKVLEDQLSPTPLVLENDASSAAAGEFWKGSCKDSNSMIMLTLGTGLGGGIILNKQLWQGEEGMAGEIGHMIIDPNGPKCNCGSNGCLESFVSAEAIRRIVRSSPALSGKTVDTEPDHIPEKIRDLALEGDDEAIKIWMDFGRYLGMGITNLINLLNVDSIAIGGGLSNAWDLFIDSTNSEIKQRALEGPKSNLKIYRAELGDDAGIIGSAYLAFNKLEFINKF
ncbi:MAG: ROK family protein [Thermodesulfobacteriota bacterium]